MSKKGIIFMVGTAMAACYAGYKAGCKKYYCCLCDKPEFEEEEGEIAEDQENAFNKKNAENEAQISRMLTEQMLDEIRDPGKLPSFRKLDWDAIDELTGKIRPEFLAYIMCCGKEA